ncbi:MAG: glycoside hydrolase family 3 C-terminal domain-containing protein [Bacteroidota bacterium]|nr:glycoside hydrolase family 3 C-terminal domain-containing protein [Bacteroidota bacterium]
MKKTILFALLSVTLTIKAQVYKDPKAPVESRVTDLVSRMTLEEKISYINGINWMYTKPIERLGIPSFKMTDGPVGARTHGKSTAYPASILAAASWDTALVYQLGVALGRDCRARGVNFLLGPGVNIARAPMGGRNFEYLGEDPFLSSGIVVSYIKGVQSQGVVATVKHFAANDQEYDRNNISSDIDERTLQEIYLPAFKSAVQKAKVGAVMNSYNLLNGTHTSENNHLNIEILKTKWGFNGILMSDWGSVHDGIEAFKGGTDLEMPGNSKMTAKVLLPAFANGTISEKAINDKVSRILRVCFSFGFFDRPQTIASIPNDDPTSAKVALNLARGGIVLLKNQDHLLPLKASKIKKIAILGPNANTYVSGGGSSQTDPFHSVNYFEGLKKAAKNMEVNYTMGIPSLSNLSSKSLFYTAPGSTTVGLKAEYYDNKTLDGTPKVIRIEKTVDFPKFESKDIEGLDRSNFSVRWTGVIKPTKTGTYKFTIKGDDGYRMWINNELAIDYWSDHGSIAKDKELQLEAGKEYSFKVEYYQSGGDASLSFAWYEPKDENYNEAVNLASAADVAIVCVGFNQQVESEGSDRPFELPAAQDSLIEIVSRANPNTIVIINSGGNVNMEKWLPKVKGLIHSFYPGQEGGTALADILLGNVNPSGKLPVSFEKKWADNPTFTNYYDTDNDKHVQYKEGLMLGYRYYDTQKVEPMFPFGFGLSYTTFAYSNLKVDLKRLNDKVSATASFDVKNTGDVDGAEVSQLYITDLVCPVIRPLKELKGFAKTFLKKGETKHVAITLDESSFSYYKAETKDFGFDAGDFEILVGASSRDIKLKKIIKL